MFPKSTRRSPSPAMSGLASWAIVLALGVALAPDAVRAQAEPSGCLSEDEQSLAQMINDYRQQNGLIPVPVSLSLTEVAQWHVWDLETNDPVGGECNLHSWSDALPQIWSAVCYTPDHANASGMWDKPREITNDAYAASGYEIAYWTSGTASASSALNGWKNSAPHNDVILNQGIWGSRNPWPAMGMGILGGHAVVWFGDIADPRGAAQPCGGTTLPRIPPVASLQVRSLYPNPFNPNLTISFTLRHDGVLHATVYQLSGRAVHHFADRLFPAGDHEMSWDGTDDQGRRLASGVYVVQLQTGSQIEIRKVALIE